MKNLFICFLCSTVLFVSNVTGQSVFQMAFGGIYVDAGRCVRQTSDSGFIVTGSMSFSSSGNQKPLLIRVAANGDTIFTEILEGIAGNGLSVEVAPDGGFFVGGIGGPDLYLTKTDSLGNPLWSKSYTGSFTDIFFNMQLLNDGGIIFCGLTHSFGAGSDDAFVIRTDANGDTIWTRTFGSLLNDRASSIFQTSDTGFIFCGLINDSVTGLSDFLLMKLDSNGNQLWARKYGSPEEDQAFSVIEAQDGSYLIGGLTRGFQTWGDISMYLIKTDSLGNMVWSRIYNASTQLLGDDILKVIQLTDGNYAFAGISSPSSASMYASITKTDTSGIPIWSMNYGGYHDIGVGLEETFDGGFAMVGYGYEGLTDYDLFFVKTDSIGNNSCNQHVNNLITSVPPTQTGFAHVTSGYAPFAVSNLQVSVSRGITGLDPCIFSNVTSVDATNQISVYPNPASGILTVTWLNETESPKLELFNMLGEQVFIISAVNQSQMKIDVSRLQSGLYLIKIAENNSVHWKKVLIEN